MNPTTGNTTLEEARELAFQATKPRLSYSDSREYWKYIRGQRYLVKETKLAHGVDVKFYKDGKLLTWLESMDLMQEVAR